MGGGWWRDRISDGEWREARERAKNNASFVGFLGFLSISSSFSTAAALPKISILDQVDALSTPDPLSPSPSSFPTMVMTNQELQCTPSAPFFGFMGITSALVFASKSVSVLSVPPIIYRKLGSRRFLAWGTEKGGGEGGDGRPREDRGLRYTLPLRSCSRLCAQREQRGGGGNKDF